MVSQQEKTLWWVKKYEANQAKVLNDPNYHLPPFVPIQQALRQTA